MRSAETAAEPPRALILSLLLHTALLALPTALPLPGDPLPPQVDRWASRALVLVELTDPPPVRPKPQPSRERATAAAHLAPPRSEVAAGPTPGVPEAPAAVEAPPPRQEPAASPSEATEPAEVARPATAAVHLAPPRSELAAEPTPEVPEVPAVVEAPPPRQEPAVSPSQATEPAEVVLPAAAPAPAASLRPAAAADGLPTATARWTSVEEPVGAPAQSVLAPSSSVLARPPAPTQNSSAGRLAPRLTRRVDPVYPAAARREGQEGTVHLRLEIKPDGRVGKVDVVTSSGFQLLDDAAVAAARKWRYEPAREDGRPVAEWRRVAVVFRLEGDAPLRVFPRPHS